MKLHLTFILSLTTITLAFGQTMVEWSPDYRIKLEDFQSPETEINGQLATSSLLTGAGISFSYWMSAAEFAFTKNFNSKVTAYFDKKAATILAPDTLSAQTLINFSQYEFDLAELYSRKLRKEMYDQKGVFSDFNFSQAIYDSIQSEMNAEVAKVFKATEFGTKHELLRSEHERVLAEIAELADFCKACTPPKKKKEKKK